MRIYCNCDIEKIVYQNGIAEGVEGSFINIDKTKLFRIGLMLR